MGPRLDTLYSGVTIQEVAKFKVFLKLFVISEKDSHKFMKLKHPFFDNFYKNYLEKKFKQFDQLCFIIYKKIIESTLLKKNKNEKKK